jgi:PAS domain S-box-containing protein
MKERKHPAELPDCSVHYRALLNITEEGVWEIDQAGTTVAVNNKLVNMLGYTESEMVGRSFLNFIAPKEKEKIEKKLGERRQGISDRYDVY